MDTRQLRAFLTVIDTGGISSAAEKLGYAQSTVSDQLRTLERDLGVSVLNRTSVGTIPTEAGARLLPYARRLLDLDGEMRRDVTGARPLLRIGTLDSIAGEWLPDILAAFNHGAGGADIEAEIVLSVASRARLHEDLAAGRLDAVIVFDNGVRAPGESATLYRDQVVLVAAPEHPLADVRPVTLDMLRKADFLVADRGCTSRMLFDQFGRDFAPEVRVAMVTGSKAALIRLVSRGIGVALMPMIGVRSDLESGDLIALDVPEGLATIGIEASWRSGLGTAEKPLRALLEIARRHGDLSALVN